MTGVKITVDVTIWTGTVALSNGETGHVPRETLTDAQG